MSAAGDEDNTDAGDAGADPVAVDLGLCKACGICIDLCPTHVFDRDRVNQPAVARPGDCTQCLLCEVHCPDFAIAVRRRAKGEAAAGEVRPPRVELEQVVVATELASCAGHDEET